MVCNKCGWSNADNSTFCVKCGQKMIPESQVQGQNLQVQAQQTVENQPQALEIQPKEMYAQNMQPVPKKKNIAKIVIPIVSVVIVLAAGIGGGAYYLTHKDGDKKDSGDEKVTEAVANVTEKEETTKKSDSDEEETTKKKADSNEKVVEVEVTVGEGTDFSDGKAWIQEKGASDWMCIDTDGNILFTVDSDDFTNFVNGYAVIDESYIINDEGEMLYEFITDGFALYDYSAMDVSRILLSQYTESVGTVMYVVDMDDDFSVEECDLSDSTVYQGYNSYPDFSYLGNGYYWLNNDGVSNTGNLELYDSVNNRMVTVSISGSRSNGGIYGIDNVERIGDSSLIRLMLNNSLYIVDMDSLTVKGKMDDVDSRLITCYGEEMLSYRTVTDITNDIWNNEWCYDLETDKLFQLTTPYDDTEMGYYIMDYENGYFLLKTFDSSGQSYVVLTDKAGTPLNTPQKEISNYHAVPEFYASPNIQDGYYSYSEGSVYYFVDIANPSQIMASVNYADGDNDSYITLWLTQADGSILIQYSDGHNFAYTKTGDVIFAGQNYVTDSEGMQDGYRYVYDMDNDTIEYWDESNQKLKITKKEIVDPDDYKAAYRKVLEKSTISWSTDGDTYDSSYISFYLVDIDNDGAEEILLYNDYASHADGYEALAYNDNGTMKYIGFEDSYIGYYPEHSVAVSNSGNQGYFCTTYYQYEDGELTTLCYYWEDQNQEEAIITYYDSNDNEITEEEFDKLLTKAVGSESMKKINTPDLKENTEANREKYLK